MSATNVPSLYLLTVTAAATFCLCLLLWQPVLLSAALEYGTPARQQQQATPAESPSSTRSPSQIETIIALGAPDDSAGGGGDGDDDQEEIMMNNNEKKRQYHLGRSSGGNQSGPLPAIQKCTKQSILLARQMLAHELVHINQFNSIWFNDLDKDELLEGQKHSLSNIVMSGAGASLLNSNGQPLIEIESSYFRQQQQQQQQGGHAQNQPITIKLTRRHADRCYLSTEKRQFTYILGLSLGPLEHHLDVVYNLPKDIGLSQPLSWRYGQISVSVPKMNYEISLRQVAPDNGNHLIAGCPLEISDVTYLQNTHAPSASIQSFGLAVNNQTLQQIDRLFDDYTRPTVSARLRQMLKFYLNSKTLPLAVISDSQGHH